MPATYKYGFLPKNRERALEAAQSEFYECAKAARKLREEIQALDKRMELLGALLGFGVGRVMPGGELRKRVEAIIDEKQMQ